MLTLVEIPTMSPWAPPGSPNFYLPKNAWGAWWTFLASGLCPWCSLSGLPLLGFPNSHLSDPSGSNLSTTSARPFSPEPSVWRHLTIFPVPITLFLTLIGLSFRLALPLILCVPSAFVSANCHNKMPSLGGLHNRHLFSHKSWSLEF